MRPPVHCPPEPGLLASSLRLKGRDGWIGAAALLMLEHQPWRKTRDTVLGPAPRTRAKRFKLLPQPGLPPVSLPLLPSLKTSPASTTSSPTIPPQPHFRNQKAQNFRPFPQLPSTHQSETQVTSVATPQSPSPQNPFPTVTPHWTSLCQSKISSPTVCLHPSLSRSSGPFPSPLPRGRAPPRARLPRPASPSPPWRGDSTAFRRILHRELTNHRRE